MEQFSLEKYLKNPNRKITTRYGDREVRIICTDRKDKRPIVALMVDMDDGSEYITSHSINGWIDDEEKYPDKRDLLFADEEEELTEFEKAVKQVMWTAYNYDDCSNGKDVDDISNVKATSKTLLDLARKELEANYYTKVLDDRMVFKSELHATDLQTAYDMGKQDALKDLPKWKKAEKNEELDCHVAIQQDDRVVLSDFVQKDEYYITLDVLKTLPKEE